MRCGRRPVRAMHASPPDPDEFQARFTGEALETLDKLSADLGRGRGQVIQEALGLCLWMRERQRDGVVFLAELPSGQVHEIALAAEGEER